jgi:hypothetical protein
MLGIAEQPRIRVALTGLELPTLVLHGGEDRLVPTIASEPFAALPNVTRIVYPGRVHEIHNEPEWTTVIDDVIRWIHDRAGGPTVPFRGSAGRTGETGGRDERASVDRGVLDSPHNRIIASGERLAR